MLDTPGSSIEANPEVYADFLTRCFDGRGLAWCFDLELLFGELRSYLHASSDAHHFPLYLLLRRAAEIDREQYVHLWWPYLEGQALPVFYASSREQAFRMLDVLPLTADVRVERTLCWLDEDV